MDNNQAYMKLQGKYDFCRLRDEDIPGLARDTFTLLRMNKIERGDLFMLNLFDNMDDEQLELFTNQMNDLSTEILK